MDLILEKFDLILEKFDLILEKFDLILEKFALVHVKWSLLLASRNPGPVKQNLVLARPDPILMSSPSTPLTGR